MDLFGEIFGDNHNKSKVALNIVDHATAAF